jgi:hypothetical protein
MSFFFLIFFQKIKKKKLISLRRGFEKPFERDDFDFLIFFFAKKKSKNQNHLSQPPLFGGDTQTFVTSPQLPVPITKRSSPIVNRW